MTSPALQPVPVTALSSPLPSPSQLLGTSSLSNRGQYKASVGPTNTSIVSVNASSPIHNAYSRNREAPPNEVQIDPAAKHDLSKSFKVGYKPGKAKKREYKVPPTFKKPPPLDIDKEPTKEYDSAKTSRGPVGPAPQADTSDVLPPKKCRRRSQTGEAGQTKMKKLRITKPGVDKDITKKKKFGPPKKPKEDRSPERLLSDAVARRKALLTPEKLVDLGLKEATRRRADWTPAKDSAALTSGEAAESADGLLTEIMATESPKARFGSLLQEYGFAERSGNIAADVKGSRVGPDITSAKKRKIDVVNVLSSVVLPGKAQTTKPTRKAQTITAKATEDFVAREGANIRTMTEYLMPPPETKALNQVKCGQPAKNSKAKPKRKKSVETACIVQSPETAMKATRNQNFVFGTSSQLVREESPTLIHDLQRALHQSEPTNGFPLPSVSPMSLTLQTSKSIALMPSRNLWSEAARNDGLVLEVENVNLADTPQPAKIPDEKTAPEKASIYPNAPSTKAQDEQHDTEKILVPPKIVNAESLTGSEPPVSETEQSLPHSIAEKALKARLKPTAPKKKLSIIQTHREQMPNYQGFSDAQLKKTIKSYGFKAIAKREAMISLLEKCWDSRKGQVLQELPSNALIQQPSEGLPADRSAGSKDQAIAKSKSPKKRGRPSKAATADTAEDDAGDVPPKKKRGRPKKGASESAAPVKQKRKAQFKDNTEAVEADEIYDSAPPTPSPPRRRNPSKTANALVLSPGESQRSESEIASPSSGASKVKSAHRARLFDAITRAVTRQPPTNDIKNLTWHEKILMYEPIIIEDLANWLNLEGFAKVDEDDEVETMLVKEWCESQSICCSWKENLRGLPRARW